MHGQLRVGYLMSRFPKVTETFVLYEMLELRRQGIDVDVYPLLRERGTVLHPGVEKMLPKVRYGRLMSWRVIGANLRRLWQQPGLYLGSLAGALVAVGGSPRFLVKALVLFPKAVWLAQDVERRGVEHLHAHFATHPALCAMIVHRLTGVSFSFTAHGSDIHVNLCGFSAKAAAAAFVVTVSHYNRRFLIERCGEAVAARLHVLHCGVDIADFASKIHAPRPRLRILCVASLREVKGHRHLIDACRLLEDRGVPFVVDLVGDGPLRVELERQIEAAGLGHVIRLRGVLPRPLVVGALQASDVAVLTSVIDRQGRREGIPVSLMEAMATGLPVVASRISGIPELVEHEREGLLTPPADGTAIADSLERLWLDPEQRRRLGCAGREKVRREFDLATNVRELHRLIRAATERGAASERRTV
ncbi:MAG: glycosyltransferase family 4 protein [Polyangiaceae bacterium]